MRLGLAKTAPILVGLVLGSGAAVVSSSRVVGIAGATGSGKSSLADYLHTHTKTVGTVIRVDDFYTGQRVDLSQRTIDAEEPTWETPDVFDWKAFTTAVTTAVDRASCDAPDAFVICEGFLLFANPEARDLVDIPLFLDVSENTSLARRWHRNSDGCTLALLEKYHQKHAWPAFLKYRRNLPADTHVISADGDFQPVCQTALSILSDL